MDIKRAKEAIARAYDEYEIWDTPDQMVFALALIRVCELCDHILAKYDGRNKRMKEVMDLLKESGE